MLSPLSAALTAMPGAWSASCLSLGTSAPHRVACSGPRPLLSLPSLSFLCPQVCTFRRTWLCRDSRSLSYQPLFPGQGLGGDAVSVLHSLSTHACLVKAEKHARAVSVPSFFSKPLSFLSSIWADRQDKAGTLTASRRRVRCRALGTGICLVWSPEGRRLPGTGAAAGQPEDGSPTTGSAPSE